MVIFGHLTAGHDAPFPEPSDSALSDALSAVAACAHATITFCGRTAADWEPLLGLFGLLASSPRHRQRTSASPPGLPHARRQAATLTVSTWRHSRRAPPSP
jgi:hypothetical protein